MFQRVESHDFRHGEYVKKRLVDKDSCAKPGMTDESRSAAFSAAHSAVVSGGKRLDH